MYAEAALPVEPLLESMEVPAARPACSTATKSPSCPAEDLCSSQQRRGSGCSTSQSLAFPQETGRQLGRQLSLGDAGHCDADGNTAGTAGTPISSCNSSPLAAARTRQTWVGAVLTISEPPGDSTSWPESPAPAKSSVGSVVRGQGPSSAWPPSGCGRHGDCGGSRREQAGAPGLPPTRAAGCSGVSSPSKPTQCSVSGRRRRFRKRTGILSASGLAQQGRR